jgi:hypothetical protein
MHTVTFDNGREFSLREKIAKELGGQVYFAPLFILGTRHQREYQWFNQTIFPQRLRLHDDHGLTYTRSRG